MSNLLTRLQSVSAIKHAQILAESELFKNRSSTPSQIPMLNVALSAATDRGLTSGVTIIAGPSKHFKTLLGWIIVKSYMDAHKDAVCVFYDNEFGTTENYAESLGIDQNRILHVPIVHIEELKFDVVRKLEEIKRGDKVIFFTDSIGNLASKKEIEDAMDEKSVADMTRAKQLKSLFRMITPHFAIKDIPGIFINHIYMEQGLYPKAIVSGGTGGYLSADTIWVLGRQQEKTGTEVTGYNFIINIEKSRYVKEKSKIPISVTWEKGVNRWTGLFDVAVHLNWIAPASKKSYALVDQQTGEVDQKNTFAKRSVEFDGDFWKAQLKAGLDKKIEKAYSVGSSEIVVDWDKFDSTTPPDPDK